MRTIKMIFSRFKWNVCWLFVLADKIHLQNSSTSRSNQQKKELNGATELYTLTFRVDGKLNTKLWAKRTLSDKRQNRNHANGKCNGAAVTKRWNRLPLVPKWKRIPFNPIETNQIHKSKQEMHYVFYHFIHSSE